MKNKIKGMYISLKVIKSFSIDTTYNLGKGNMSITLLYQYGVNHKTKTAYVLCNGNTEMTVPYHLRKKAKLYYSQKLRGII